MEKFYLNFRYFQKYLFFTFLLLSVYNSFGNYPFIEVSDSVQVNCIYPTYTTRNTDVSSPNINDGRLLITNIYNTTHYEIIEGNNTPFDFSQSFLLDPNKNEIEIKNISNPTGIKIYRIRLYNNSATCFTDQTVTFEHINFALNRDYSQVELMQAVDNSTPQRDEIVTFTTIIQNKGTRAAENLEVRLVVSQSLETVNFYSEAGNFTSLGNIWRIGKLDGGRTIKLVVRSKVKGQGLSYFSTYISEEDDKKYNYSEAQALGNESTKKSGSSCVTVPISIKNDEVYNIVLKEYKNVIWYYKDESGNFSEINDKTNPALAVINPDSTLTIKQSGEYSFSKKVDDCNIGSCCPIIVESCAGPTIIVDSVYCNTSVDSYNIIVELKNDNFSIIEKVFFAMTNLNFPVLTNYLNRINALPLTSSSGFVTSLGNSRYKIENIPAFMPNVTLVSSDLTGKCRNIRIVNAPNCTIKPLGTPQLAETVMFMTEGERPPAFSVITKSKETDVIWFADELGQKIIHKGLKFRPANPGEYYVAFRDKKTKSLGVLKKAEMKELKTSKPATFNSEDVCGCDNPLMVPQGDLGDLATAKAYPNPVSDILTVDYRIPSTANKAELFFTNMSGRNVKNIDLVNKSSSVKIEVLKWADGTYVYTLVIDGVKVNSQKIVVSHN
jgi:uncharacterized repeat protein (TIGR01451 family)